MWLFGPTLPVDRYTFSDPTPVTRFGRSHIPLFPVTTCGTRLTLELHLPYTPPHLPHTPRTIPTAFTVRCPTVTALPHHRFTLITWVLGTRSLRSLILHHVYTHYVYGVTFLRSALPRLRYTFALLRSPHRVCSHTLPLVRLPFVRSDDTLFPLPTVLHTSLSPLPWLITVAPRFIPTDVPAPHTVDVTHVGFFRLCRTVAVLFAILPQFVDTPFMVTGRFYVAVHTRLLPISHAAVPRCCWLFVVTSRYVLCSFAIPAFLRYTRSHTGYLHTTVSLHLRYDFTTFGLR